MPGGFGPDDILRSIEFKASFDKMMSEWPQVAAVIYVHAKAQREYYMSLINLGFNEEQAMYLTDGFSLSDVGGGQQQTENK